MQKMEQERRRKLQENMRKQQELEDRYQDAGSWVSSVISEKNPDSRMSFINTSYEQIHSILQEIDNKRIEVNARFVVFAVKSSSLSQLRNILGNYWSLQAFCRDAIARHHHIKASYSTQARTVLSIIHCKNAITRQDVGDVLFPFVCRLVGSRVAP